MGTATERSDDLGGGGSRCLHIAGGDSLSECVCGYDVRFTASYWLADVGCLVAL